jgi:hypothetical protein
MKPWVVSATGGLSMMEIRPKLRWNLGQRCNVLNIASHAVRQQSTRSDGDLDMWLLSHLMRDAETNAQVDVAERKYGVWLQTLAP